MSYALITGASSGMGLCYAKELARMGYNIIAVSNQPAELEAVAASLRTEYAIEAHAIYADLAERSAAKMLFDRCQSEGWEVEILISNAGMLLFSTLTNTTPERLATIIDLHCTTTTLLCRYFGEAMKQRGKGRILIMSSSTAWLPYPTISHYSATKAYLKNFAFALWYELHRYGVSVTALFPGAVNTPFYKLSDKMRSRLSSLGVLMRPEAVAKRGISAMMRGKRRLTPGLFTRLVVAICAILPARVLDIIIRIKPIRELLERI
ncbi:MAG: SDR family NAD(P)-dependent oxidoreductase [Alistipes sp.]|nr:SDR family NAD(P)-dependent oxidoreductase [Alistipes sp.]